MCSTSVGKQRLRLSHHTAGSIQHLQGNGSRVTSEMGFVNDSLRSGVQERDQECRRKRNGRIGTNQLCNYAMQAVLWVVPVPCSPLHEEQGNAFSQGIP